VLTENPAGKAFGHAALGNYMLPASTTAGGGKLSSAFVIAASAAVTGHDFLAPIVSDVDVSSIASRMPSWAWPLVVISLTALFQFLRSLADKRHEVELVDATAAGERQ
jgi:hypothetical protein